MAGQQGNLQNANGHRGRRRAFDPRPRPRTFRRRSGNGRPDQKTRLPSRLGNHRKSRVRRRTWRQFKRRRASDPRFKRRPVHYPLLPRRESYPQRDRIRRFPMGRFKRSTGTLRHHQTFLRLEHLIKRGKDFFRPQSGSWPLGRKAAIWAGECLI